MFRNLKVEKRFFELLNEYISQYNKEFYSLFDSVIKHPFNLRQHAIPIRNYFLGLSYEMTDWLTEFLENPKEFLKNLKILGPNLVKDKLLTKEQYEELIFIFETIEKGLPEKDIIVHFFKKAAKATKAKATDEKITSIIHKAMKDEPFKYVFRFEKDGGLLEMLFYNGKTIHGKDWYEVARVLIGELYADYPEERDLIIGIVEALPNSKVIQKMPGFIPEHDEHEKIGSGVMVECATLPQIPPNVSERIPKLLNNKEYV